MVLKISEKMYKFGILKEGKGRINDISPGKQ